MRHLIPALLLLAAPASAGGHGYLYFGPGSERTAHLGGGGEGFVYQGLAVGGEIGYLFSRDEFRYGLGLLSANAAYHVNARSHWRLQPFVTAGYSLGFRQGAGHYVNAGGGVTYWFSDHAGLRVEYREYIPTAWRGDLREVRFGLALR